VLLVEECCVAQVVIDMSMDQWLVDYQCKTKNCSIATLSAISLICSQLGLNPRFHGEKPTSSFLNGGVGCTIVK
jgi:hypothetical protein